MKLAYLPPVVIGTTVLAFGNMTFGGLPFVVAGHVVNAFMDGDGRVSVRAASTATLRINVDPCTLHEMACTLCMVPGKQRDRIQAELAQAVTMLITELGP